MNIKSILTMLGGSFLGIFVANKLSKTNQTFANLIGK